MKLGVHFQSIQDNDKYFFNNDDKKSRLSEIGIESMKKNDRASYTKKRFGKMMKQLRNIRSTAKNSIKYRYGL